jgi:hypothetical protein
MATELVRLNPDLIVSANTAELLALQRATSDYRNIRKVHRFCSCWLSRSNNLVSHGSQIIQRTSTQVDGCAHDIAAQLNRINNWS